MSWTSEHFTVIPARPSKFWRSSPNRRLSHGWHSSEIRSERGLALREIKGDLSRYLREAEMQEIIITRHGKPAGVRVGFKSEEDWFEYRLEHDPRFLQRVEQARNSLRGGL
ncbi:type II toxin-antitoxin system Phd/YefM family antitoxin [Bradyrhizobium sp. 38]|nr:type II toxin-antitoxin system Phd/YefM family antitoxin [Bradyrhizobium sp. 38]MCK1781451.1 type II toxin-antitoxin system Phd/YefM family antitoxin [Bradyrhizobium sp. 132]